MFYLENIQVLKKISTMDQIKERFINRIKGTITFSPLQTSSVYTF